MTDHIDVETKDRQLAEGFERIRWSSLRTIDDVVTAIVENCGGIDVLKAAYPNLQILKDATINLDFGDYCAQLPADFNVPLGIIPDKILEDFLAEAGNVRTIVRVLIMEEIRRRLITAILYARRPKQV